jgi:uncharacterized iron-regulated membrane protein
MVIDATLPAVPMLQAYFPQVEVAELTVVGINTIRMAMMGISESHYVMIHGTVGSTITSWMIVGVTVGLCLWGTRSDWTKFKTVRLSTK